jgi:hypothetical protein
MDSSWKLTRASISNDSDFLNPFNVIIFLELIFDLETRRRAKQAAIPNLSQNSSNMCRTLMLCIRDEAFNVHARVYGREW